MLNQLGLNLPLTNRGTDPVVEEGDMPFKPEIFGARDRTLNGYWQSEKYFDRVKDRIRDEIFTPPGFAISAKTSEIALEIMKNPNSAFLHIRRSDNLSARALCFHGLLDFSYYRLALAYIRERIPNVCFYVFSDDPEWCRNQSEFSDMTIVGHNPMSGTTDANGIITKKLGGREVEDLYLMSLCRHAIIANSTFSWWGAWLYYHQQTERIIVAPKVWFKPVPDTPDYRDIVPDRWIKL